MKKLIPLTSRFIITFFVMHIVFTWIGFWLYNEEKSQQKMKPIFYFRQLLMLSYTRKLLHTDLVFKTQLQISTKQCLFVKGKGPISHLYQEGYPSVWGEHIINVFDPRTCGFKHLQKDPTCWWQNYIPVSWRWCYFGEVNTVSHGHYSTSL